jgi:hypothetical protein
MHSLAHFTFLCEKASLLWLGFLVSHEIKLFETLPSPLDLLYLQHYYHLDPTGTQVAQLQSPQQP